MHIKFSKKIMIFWNEIDFIKEDFSKIESVYSIVQKDNIIYLNFKTGDQIILNKNKNECWEIAKEYQYDKLVEKLVIGYFDKPFNFKLQLNHVKNER